MSMRFVLLETFVLVARSGSMKDAARLLSVTPGAISQRIRLLEETVGHRLFVRSRAGVRLDARGVAMFSALDGPWRAIESVDGRLSARPSSRVAVSTVASFAANWLVPRLGRFARLHPDIEIVVETGGRLVDLRREPVDVAIRHGLGSYAGLQSVRLVAPELIVVASPDLLKSGRPIAEPADCLAYPLLHDLDRGDWSLWFEANGVAATKRLKGASFSDDHLLVRAAVAGQGLALVRDVYAEGDLVSRRLVKALDIGWPTRFAYYAVTRPERELKPAVRQFRKWLIEEAEESRG